MIFHNKDRQTTVFFFDETTGEFSHAAERTIKAGMGVPRGSTELAPMKWTDGFKPVFDGSVWVLVQDHRGKTLFNKLTKQPARMGSLGPIPDGYTDQVPGHEFDKWTESGWVLDQEALDEAIRQHSQQRIDSEMARVTPLIQAYQDKVDMGKAEEYEITNMEALREYRVALLEVDLLKPDWPPLPIRYTKPIAKAV